MKKPKQPTKKDIETLAAVLWDTVTLPRWKRFSAGLPKFAGLTDGVTKREYLALAKYVLTDRQRSKP